MRHQSISKLDWLKYLHISTQTAGLLDVALLAVASDNDINEKRRVDIFTAECRDQIAEVLDGFGPDQH